MNSSQVLTILEDSTTKMFVESGEAVQAHQSAHEDLPEGLTCIISFNGDVTGQVIVFWDVQSALKFAQDKMKFFCGVDVIYTAIDEEVIEVIAEFTNEVAGAFLTSLSRGDISIKIMTPIISTGSVAYPNYDNLKVVAYNLGQFEMHLGLLLDADASMIKH